MSEVLTELMEYILSYQGEYSWVKYLPIVMGILGTIVTMITMIDRIIPDEGDTWYHKFFAIFKKIGNIPIIGDILKWLLSFSILRSEKKKKQV